MRMTAVFSPMTFLPFSLFAPPFNTHSFDAVASVRPSGENVPEIK